MQHDPKFRTTLHNNVLSISSPCSLEFRKVARRNGCQHTSCNACFLLVRPDCNRYKCIEPPNKRCLRQYYECIRDHYFSPPQESSYPVMMVSVHVEGARGWVCIAFGVVQQPRPCVFIICPPLLSSTRNGQFVVATHQTGRDLLPPLNRIIECTKVSVVWLWLAGY